MIFCHPTKSVKAQIKENKLKIYTPMSMKLHK